MLAFSATASGASVASSGSFHIAQKAVGCHYVVYGPVSAGLGATAKIRCERYSDHTIVTLSTTGVVAKTTTGVAVPVGTVSHPIGWLHRFTTKMTCNVLGYGSSSAIDCSYGSKSEFVLGPGIARVTK